MNTIVNGGFGLPVLNSGQISVAFSLQPAYSIATRISVDDNTGTGARALSSWYFDGANLAGLSVSPYLNSHIGMIVKGQSSQSGSLFELKDSTNATLSKFNANGYLSVGTSSSPTGGVATFNGNVGIGTTAPASILHLHSTAVTTDRRIILSDATSGATTTDGLHLIKSTLQEGYLWNYENAGLHFGVNNAEALTILAGGNVGIGTTGPTKKLDVNGTAKATSLISDNRLAQGSRQTYMYDDFDRSDRVLNGDTAPTGQTWVVSGPGQTTANISNGTLNDTVNYYASLDYGTTIKRVAGTFSFGSGAGTDRSQMSMTLAADENQIGINDMLHLNFGPNGWDLQKWVGGIFTSIATGTLNLRTDGTVYPVAMEINTATNTVVVIAPDGTRTSITDAAIGSTIVPRYGWIQYVGNSNSAAYKGSWHSFSMGPSIAEAVRAEGLGAGLTDLTLFNGSGLTQRQKITGTLTGGAGWYRIANKAVLGSFAISGNVKITASDPIGRNTYWDIDASTVYGEGTPSLVQNFE